MIKKPAMLTRLSNTVLGFLAFLGILALVALIAQRHPLRLALTQNKRFSLSEQSQKIVKGLKGDVDIKAFYQETGRNRDQTHDLLETYRYYSNKIHYEFIDPDRQPGLARQYQVRTYGTLVLEGFGKSQTITSSDEEAITNAILKLNQEREKVVYFSVGHGERDLSDFDKNGYSTAKSAIQKENFQAKTLNLLVDPRVPEDAAVVVIADPRKPLLSTEIEALRQYLAHNGSVMVLLEPFSDGGLRDFLKSYGLLLKPDIIVDTMSRVFGADYLMPVITQYGLHKITEGFNIACFFPTARTVFIDQKRPAGIDLTELVFSSVYSWSDTTYSLESTRPPEFDQVKDKKGPLPVAAVAAVSVRPGEKTRESKEQPGRANAGAQAQLAVFGDSDFASNNYFSLQGNGDFFLNTINFLAQRADLISIERPKTKSAPLTLNRTQGQLLLWIGLLLMPTITLAAGILVLRSRRKHR
jgi:ABC-type uncharacterized transport system involved in gliding motility auxiliary subunit